MSGPPRRHPVLDAHWIARKVWQGSYPRRMAGVIARPDVLRKLGFSAIVLCAQEHQPDASVFPGVEIIRAPIDDDVINPVPEAVWAVVQRAARRAADVRLTRGRVLVTCRAGLNRSGIVTVSLLRLLAPPHTSTQDLIARVRRSRPGALFNPRFVEALEARLV